MPAHKDIPIIFPTGKLDMKSRIEAFENGGVDFICIPYNQIELLKRIEVHLKLKLMQDELKAKNNLLAEKVHSREVYDKVVDLGVCYSQGYFIGKPEFI